jgi:NAD(P)-dependent dehydrogenase (short-subunit alcohol dehydrogenase family)
MKRTKLIALITGGAKGLGRMLAEHLVEQGHFVYILDKVPAEKIEPTYLKILSGYHECDLSDPLAIETCFKVLVKKTQRVDVLINNASIRQFKKLEEFQPDEICEAIQVNLISSILLSHFCLQLMKKNNFGRIITISSISAFQGYSTGSLYCSCKRALLVFTESVSRELQYFDGAITVNSICPDSFSQIEGTPLKNHERITKSIISNIDQIIQTKKNGKLIPIFTIGNRLIESMRLLKSAINIILS